MGCSAILMLLVAAGCNQVFGIRTTVELDASVALPVITFVSKAATDEQHVKLLTVDFDHPITAGSAIVACVYTEGTSTVAISDALGNTYQKVTGPYSYSYMGSIQGYMAIYTALSSRAGSDTVTASAQDATDILLMSHELRNVVAIEGGAGAPGFGWGVDGMMSPAIQTTGSNDLIFGFGITRAANGGTSFTTYSTYNGNITEGAVVTAPGSYQAIATDDNDDEWTMLGAAFRGPDQ